MTVRSHVLRLVTVVLGLLVVTEGCTAGAPPKREEVAPPHAPVVALPAASLPSDASAPAPPLPDRGIAASEAGEVLFPAEAKEGIDPSPTCPSSAERAASIDCLLALRYAKDSVALEHARAMFVRHGHVCGIEVPHVMDGGYRGSIRIVPALPIAKDEKVLAWTLEAFDGAKEVYDALAKKSTKDVPYRTTDLSIRFFRSVDRTTPNAYAQGWSVAINVQGSLLTSSAALRETLVHEMFHLNDANHAEWSLRMLQASYLEIVTKCGARTACLAPYAPNDTMVRNGTFYAFQPGNDVREYAAELAVRYFKEQRARLRGEASPGKSFKCGPAPNPGVWEAFVREFFGGIDLVPPC